MDKILVHIVFPFLLACVMVAIIIIYEFATIKKYKHKKKIFYVEKVQQAKKYLIAFAVIETILFSYITYLSFDLIKQDYVVCEAKYTERYKRGRSAIYSVHFQDGENEYVFYTSAGEIGSLNEGENYVVTYGRRTKRIVAIERVDDRTNQE